MGYPAATGRGTLRTDATRTHREGSVVFFCAPCMAQRGEGGKGGSRQLGNTGRYSLTASRKNASDVFIGTVTCHRIKRESPMHVPVKASCRPVMAPILKLKGWRATLLSSKVEQSILPYRHGNANRAPNAWANPTNT